MNRRDFVKMSGGFFAVPFASSMVTEFTEMAFASTQLLPDVAAASSINISLANSAASSLQTLQNNMENYTATYADATNAISALNSHFANLTTISYNSQKTSQILANETAILSSGKLPGTAAEQQQFFSDMEMSGVTGFQGMISARVANVAAIIKNNGGWPEPGTSGTSLLQPNSQPHLALATIHLRPRSFHAKVDGVGPATCSSLGVQAGELAALAFLSSEVGVGVIFLIAAGIVAIERSLLCD